ncbi:DUF262 domain-containing protein [Candidatus Saccharibacteria bacterium]|nr:MAG: DUF262 domain-containing protein [Candidatus Saccharibacteria bacterium]
MISAQTNIQKILNASETYYEIPNFQRPYAWQTGNANEFLVDLEDSVAKRKNHYFGTVVLVEETASTYSVAIIDGQQRVTTSLLMVTAIYHLVKKDPSLIENPETTPELIRDRYLFNANIDKNKVKLRTVTTDNQILQHIFDKDGEESRLEPRERMSNIYQVYSTFRKYFSTRKGLDKYIEGLKLFEVISITLNGNDDNPQRVFESINSTGKPLTDGDKIRNFALMLGNDKLRNHVYDNYWSIIEESLVDSNKDNITDFFRSYIMSKRQAIVRLDAVYPEFKKQFDRQVGESQEEVKIDAFYADIVESLGFYRLLKLIDTDDFESQYKGICETIFKMRYLQIDLYIPFAMNVLRHHANGELTDQQFEDVFKLIETYFSRRIVSGIATTSVDRFLASLHKDILSYQKDSPDADYVDVLRYILLNRIGQTRIPDDAEYENAIRTREAYYQRNSFLIYVLTAVEGTSKEAVHTLHQISDAKLKLSIEHVMPQTLTSRDWQEMLGDDYERIHREYLHTLANLTLTGYNSEYSNRPYADKMHLEIKDKKTGEVQNVGFADSKLPINVWIAKHDVWNEDTLKERQAWWVKKLKDTWSFPVTSFKPIEEDTSVYLLEATDLKGRSIRSVDVFGEKNSVTTWSEALDTITESIYNRNPEFIETISNDEWLSKIIRQDASAFNSSAEILDTGYFVDTGNDTNTKLRIINALGKLFGLTQDDIKAELTADKHIEEDEE